MPVCAGVTRSGERCRRFVREGTHCALHGTAAVVVQPRAYFLPENIAQLNGTNLRAQLVALNAFNRVRSDADVRAFLQANVLQRILDFSLSETEDETLRDRASWVLINLTSAPGDTGALAILAARPDFITTVADLLVTEGPEMAGNFLWCLGNMAASVPAQALAMLDAELHLTCTDFLKNPRISKNVAKLAAFVLSNLAPQTSPVIAQELMIAISSIPPIVLTRLEILEDLLWAINKLYMKCGHIETETCHLLVGILDSVSNKVVKPAIETLAEICGSNNSAIINVMLVSGVVPRFHTLFRKPLYKNIALFSLSNLACEPAGAKRILEEPGLLMDINVELPNRDAVWTIGNLIQRGGQAATNAALRCGAIQALLPIFRNANEPMQTIILEAFIELLKNGGGHAYTQLRLNGIGHLPTTHSNPAINTLLLAMRHEMVRYAFVELPLAPAPTPAPTPVGEAQPLTAAASLAAARMGEAVSRGLPQPAVNISDLVFTAADVAHLIGLGFTFRNDGHLVATRS